MVSREDGSGTRGAFIEIFGLEQKWENGNRKDLTTKEAITANKADVMLINVASDKNAIGYSSLQSLNSQVKALKIDGVEPSAENIKNGNYEVSRKFNVVTGTSEKPLVNDFLWFIFSEQGQEIVESMYIGTNGMGTKYQNSAISGRITVSGSSSVSPIMEKLKEGYVKLNDKATIDVQMTDSTSGIMSVIEGTCDIGLSSRELKESEKDKVACKAFAIDGLAVVVNVENEIDGLSRENVRKIFSGDVIKWSEMRN